MDACKKAFFVYTRTHDIGLGEMYVVNNSIIWETWKMSWDAAVRHYADDGDGLIMDSWAMKKKEGKCTVCGRHHPCECEMINKINDDISYFFRHGKAKHDKEE